MPIPNARAFVGSDALVLSLRCGVAGALVLPLERVQLNATTDGLGTTVYLTEADNTADGPGACNGARRLLDGAVAAVGSGGVFAAAPTPYPMRRLEWVGKLSQLGPGRALWYHDALARGDPPAPAVVTAGGATQRRLRAGGAPARHLADGSNDGSASSSPPSPGLTLRLVIPADIFNGASAADVTLAQQESAGVLLAALSDAQASVMLDGSTPLMDALSLSGFLDAYAAATGVNPVDMAAALVVSEPVVDVPSVTPTGTPSSSLQTGTPSPRDSSQASVSPGVLIAATRLTAAGVAHPGATLALGGGSSGAPTALVFPAHSASSGRELFVADPAAPSGARLVVDAAPGTSSGDPAELARLPDGSVVFAVSQGGAPVLAVISANVSSWCVPALSPALTSPAQPMVLQGALLFVATAALPTEGGGGTAATRALWRLAPAELARGLCAPRDAPIVATRMGGGGASGTSIAIVSRPTTCGGRVALLATRPDSNGTSLHVALINPSTSGDGAAIAPIEWIDLPSWAQPLSPPSLAHPVTSLLPYPRCIGDGTGLAFASAAGPVVAVSLTTGDVAFVSASGGAPYNDATALVPLGGSALCFTADVAHERRLLCTSAALPAGGIALAQPAVPAPGIRPFAPLPWALAAGGRVWLPCYSAQGTGPHPCAFHLPTGELALAQGVVTPYSSFTAVGGVVFFAGAHTGDIGEAAGQQIVSLWAAAAAKDSISLP